MTSQINRLVLLWCCLLILTIRSAAWAQTFPVDTLLYNGPTNKFINLVFLGDGFQDTELPAYLDHSEQVRDYLLMITPFAEYRNYFNVFAISVPSVDSGADHPGTASDAIEPVFPVADVNTHFNSSFDIAGIHRLLAPQNHAAINAVILANFPQVDQKFMLVNSTHYGGSGGSNATSSLNASSFEIMVHEIGHSFANLADEYYAGDGFASERANMTQTTDPEQVKWKNWLGVEGVGIFQHCCGGNSALWYRPHENCKMRVLGTQYPFCPVCRETFVERIHTLFGTPVTAVHPAGQMISLCEGPVEISSSIVRPEPNSLQVRWLLNGEEFVQGVDTVILDPQSLQTGSHELVLEVLDTTWMIRSAQHEASHTYTRSWTVHHIPAIAPIIIPEGPTTFCAGQSVFLSSSEPAAIYAWSNGGMGSSIEVSAEGEYVVTITNTYGCSAVSAPVEVTVWPLPAQPVITVEDTYLMSSYSIGNQWFLDNEPIPDATDSTWNAHVTGLYSVRVTDSNGCTSVSEEVLVLISSTTADAAEEEVKIIPNPGDGRFYVQAHGHQIVEVSVYTVQGQLIYKGKPAGSEIDLSGHARGIYDVVIKTTQGHYIRKAVFQ